MKQYILPRLFWIFLTLQLSACIGGGDIGDVAEGGLEGTGLSTGSISNFGSIFVNGTKYDTSAAEVIINDEISSIDQLKLGMYVNVLGQQNRETEQGTANSIEYRDLLHGPIVFVNVEAAVLQILGLSVHIDADTFLYGINAIDELQAGDVVRVSGAAIASAPGIPPSIDATLLEYLPQASNAFSVVGSLMSLDENTQTFFIGGRRFNYSEARILPTQLHEQTRVEVKGRQVQQGDNLPVSFVDELRELPLLPLPIGSMAQIKGKITRYVDPQNFEVEYRQVSLPQTLVDELAVSLQQGLIANLTGISNTEGVIDINHIEVSVPTTAVNQSGQLFIRSSGLVEHIGLMEQIPQTLTVFGVTGLLSTDTNYLDVSGSLDYGETDLRIGDYLMVLGALNSQGVFHISDVFFIPFALQNERQLMGNSGNVDSVNRQLTILGVSVLTSEQTRYYDTSTVSNFQLPPPGPPLVASTDTQINAERFFTLLQSLPNKVVYTLGEAQGDQVLAKELMLLPFELALEP